MVPICSHAEAGVIFVGLPSATCRTRTARSRALCWRTLAYYILCATHKGSLLMQHRVVAHPEERHGSHYARMPVDNLLPVVDELVQCRKHKQSADVNIVASLQHRALSSLR
jgi:hypothetical protein